MPWRCFSPCTPQFGTVSRRVSPRIGSGIPQVEGELLGRLEQNWRQIIATKFAGGVCAIGAGLSLGGEGLGIQLGAMVDKGFSRLTKKLKTEEKMLMTCGAGVPGGIFLSLLVLGAVTGGIFARSADALRSSLSGKLRDTGDGRILFGGRPLTDYRCDPDYGDDGRFQELLLPLCRGADCLSGR